MSDKGIIETVGDLKRRGLGVTGHCRAHGQRDVDLDQVIAKVGADWVYIGRRWPIKCAVCGGPLLITIGALKVPGG